MLEKPLMRVEIHDPKSDLEAFVVIDTILNSFSAGGLRMTASVDMAEVESLARTMTYKMALIGIPLGGAKSGIRFDPSRTEEERKKVLAAFGRAVKPLVEAGYLIGEDMGTTSADIEHLHEAAGINQVFFALKAAKDRGFNVEIPKDLDPVEFGRMETNLTGIGVMRSVLEVIDFLEINPEKASASIQGFGNVGAGTARHLREKGIIIKAIADEMGTIYKGDGLDIDDLEQACDDKGLIQRDKLNSRNELLPGAGWLEADVDILIPAAIPAAINSENANKIKAKAVVQAANIPVTMEAEELLHKNGVWVVPDFVANAGTAGGLTVFLVGQAPLHPPTIYQVVGDRIANATGKTLRKSKESGRLPREIAQEEALAFIASCKEVSGFKVVPDGS